MHNLLKKALFAGFIVHSTYIFPIFAEDLLVEKLSIQLQKAFNNKEYGTISKLLNSNQKSSTLINSYKKFTTNFPNAKWVINPSTSPRGKRRTLNVFITAKGSNDNRLYTLEAKQTIAIKAEKNKIISQELLGEYSILISGDKPLPISINIPNSVLTGERYDVDIIIEKPIKNAIVAGGLISIESNNIDMHQSPSIELLPMGGGGLFKSVKAPLTPGYQRWAALLAHPDSLISVTKIVRVVSDEKEQSET